LVDASHTARLFDKRAASAYNIHVIESSSRKPGMGLTQQAARRYNDEPGDEHEEMGFCASARFFACQHRVLDLPEPGSRADSR
jgi:hypothetical protein